MLYTMQYDFLFPQIWTTSQDFMDKHFLYQFIGTRKSSLKDGKLHYFSKKVFNNKIQILII